MKVLFFISVMGHGRGGHFHSLNHIVEALSYHLDAQIVTVGKGKSHIIENNKSFLTHVNTDRFGFYGFRKRIMKIIFDFQPDILHCFDLNIYNLLKIGIYPMPVRIVVNKCGGPDPIDFPTVSHLVLFSEENKQWFEGKPKFKKTAIYLIPNRVNRKELLVEGNGGVKKNDENFTFVRICRIGKSYQKSLEDSIRLIQKLILVGRSHVCLYIIGSIEDVNVLQKLQEQSHGFPIKFLSDDIYTKKGSDMLYLADAVIATGRGIMEATALGKPVLTPAVNADIPILVAESNFSDFFTTNFSQRNVALAENLDSNFEDILSVIDNKEIYLKLANCSENIFLEHFDVNNGVAKYLKVYIELLNLTKKTYTIFKDLKFQIGAIYNTFLK